MNKVVGGDYKDGKIMALFGNVAITTTGGFDFDSETIVISKDTVDSYEVIDSTSQKSATSAIARGAVGSFFLGPLGLAAALSAKSKGTYLVALYFHNGKRSLVECDQRVYKTIVKALF